MNSHIAPMSDIPIGARIAYWADKLRDLSATGLHYSKDAYDRERYIEIRRMASEMLEASTTASMEDLGPIEATVFSRMTPYTAAAGVVIDGEGRILLMRRADNAMWGMPAGGT